MEGKPQELKSSVLIGLNGGFPLSLTTWDVEQ